NPQASDSEDPDQIHQAQTIGHADDVPDEPEAATQPRHPRLDAVRRAWRRVPKEAKVRGAAETIGLVVDAGLMGAGSAGVGLMQSIAAREITATAPEVAIIDRLLHHSGHERSEKDVRRLLMKLGTVAVGVSVAIVAQKSGLYVAEHMYDHSINHGFGHFAVPLTSKVGAMTGLSAVRRNISRFF
ncbi:MAG: hypothetical protein KGI38_12175, partial [Thaumarchaeota archaeon]|nr:hypothetical protein [Nitrososphaerota archaeon]